MPKQKGEIKLIASVAIALVIFYIFYATLIAPYFANSYEYGFGTAPCNKDNTCSGTSTNLFNGYCATGSSTEIACANCNTTTGYSTFLSNCFALKDGGDYINGTACYQCSSFGFKTVSTGLLLFIFVIGLIFFAIAFLRATKFGLK